MEKDRKNPNQTTLRPTNTGNQSIEIDVDYYQSIIDDPDVSESRKRELIEIIGRIVVQFIDIGFDVHPVQQAQADKTERLTSNNLAEKERKAERIDA